MNFNLRSLRLLGQQLLSHSKTDAYSSNMLDPQSEQAPFTRITTGWIQSFSNRFRIVSCAHTGKHVLTHIKRALLKKVAFDLGIMNRMLSSAEFDEKDLENADETHFIFDMENLRKLGIAGENEVKYADLVSGVEEIIVLIRVSAGRNGTIHPLFLIFMNKDINYPIRGTPYTVPGVAYLTGSKCWIDTTIFPQRFPEPYVFSHYQTEAVALVMWTAAVVTTTPRNCGLHLIP